MSLVQWAFSDAEPHQTADGRHTFYRVRGERTTKASIGYGLTITTDETGLLLATAVEGEGPTPEEALKAAMQKALAEDERNRTVMWNTQVAVMGGTNFR